jgi:hypothetical protein
MRQIGRFFHILLFPLQNFIFFKRMSDPLGKLITVAVIGGVAFLGYEAYECSQKHGGELDLVTLTECILGSVLPDVPGLNPNDPRSPLNPSSPDSPSNPQNSNGYVSWDPVLGGPANDTKAGCALDKIIDSRFGYNSDTQQCMKYHAKGGENQPTQNIEAANLCKKVGGWFDQSQGFPGQCCNRNNRTTNAMCLQRERSQQGVTSTKHILLHNMLVKME